MADPRYLVTADGTEIRELPKNEAIEELRNLEKGLRIAKNRAGEPIGMEVLLDGKLDEAPANLVAAMITFGAKGTTLETPPHEGMTKIVFDDVNAREVADAGINFPGSSSLRQRA